MGTMSAVRKFAARHQLWNPGRFQVWLYDYITGFSKKVMVPPYTPEVPFQNTTSMNIIIAMFRANVTSNFLDLYLYRALKHAGHNVKVVLCDGEVFPCDNIAGISNIFNYRCLQCKSIQRLFKKHIAESDVIYLEKCTKSKRKMAINAIASAKRFDMSENYDKDLAERYQLTYESVWNMLDAQDKVDFVIMSHGLYATWGAFRDYCKENEINYLTWGRTYFSKMLGVVKNAAFNEGPISYDKNVVLTISHDYEYKVLVASLESRINGGPPVSDTVNYYQYLKAESMDNAAKEILNKAQGRKVIAVYLSIPWDGTVYGSNGEFRSQKDLIGTIVDAARSNPNLFFVFRIHPRESEMLEKAATHIEQAIGESALENIVVTDPLSELTSYRLAEFSSLNILYSGTLAIEFAYAGYPLVVCGKNIVDGIDSVTMVSSYKALHDILQSTQFESYRPKKEAVLAGLKKIAAVLYDDDLTVSNNYAVETFKNKSELIYRIIQELITK